MNQSSPSAPSVPPPGALRTVLCVGGDDDPWMSGFRDYVVEQGYKPFSLPLAASLSGAVSAVPFGVVVFDVGEDKTPAKLKRIRECTRYLDVPIVAISADGDRLGHALLLAAGAHVQLPAGSPFANVFRELIQRADIRPILTEIQTKVLGPFVESTRLTFQEMAQVELQVRASYQKQTYKMFGDVSAVLGLFGASEGAMVLSFPRACAIRVTQLIFPSLPVEGDEELVKDCVAELANIIAGRTKGALAGTPHSFNLSTPTLITGTEHVIQHKSGVPSLVTVFHGSIGEFALQICMALA
ncbi:MAG: chemotaxis protein CheX [Planctomycetota bacterium]